MQMRQNSLLIHQLGNQVKLMNPLFYFQKNLLIIIHRRNFKQRKIIYRQPQLSLDHQ
jgi:hypothetical protein